LEEELKELISDLNRAVLRGADPEDPVFYYFFYQKVLVLFFYRK
jgi:hypothetical protein